ncbi:ORF6 [Ictalurid herpesvirus 1]|uniref:Putative membrane protein ORF6 n=1 Tax=Ictalurid herpesvirus 1 (strain Auburn) TaxID=766178 RepID=VG06_ICHVA|nr:ORF6 [Ictalurid herpesvirus 1]NP_041175.1 ORF6 [Ictalurid herpesvirus 1]Q00102.1 RecName: Full=Putative membrane protein ORF6 [Ictalurid herpesvirus 1 (strain Auburn)]AAA88109.1 ORF6 [Ictalurid herpesvirus 1]AAA88187.1 ORF6 [Ictalurid herpesvirus 1]
MNSLTIIFLLSGLTAYHAVLADGTGSSESVTAGDSGVVVLVMIGALLTLLMTIPIIGLFGIYVRTRASIEEMRGILMQIHLRLITGDQRSNRGDVELGAGASLLTISSQPPSYAEALLMEPVEPQQQEGVPLEAEIRV